MPPTNYLVTPETQFAIGEAIGKIWYAVLFACLPSASDKVLRLTYSQMAADVDKLDKAAGIDVTGNNPLTLAQARQMLRHNLQIALEQLDKAG